MNSTMSPLLDRSTDVPGLDRAAAAVRVERLPEPAAAAAAAEDLQGEEDQHEDHAAGAADADRDRHAAAPAAHADARRRPPGRAGPRSPRCVRVSTSWPDHARCGGYSGTRADGAAA